MKQINLNLIRELGNYPIEYKSADEMEKDDAVVLYSDISH